VNNSILFAREHTEFKTTYLSLFIVLLHTMDTVILHHCNISVSDGDIISVAYET